MSDTTERIGSEWSDLLRLAKWLTPMWFWSLWTGLRVRELLENSSPEVAVQVADAIRTVVYNEKQNPNSLMLQDSKYVKPILTLIEAKFKELWLTYMLDVKTLSDGWLVNIPVPIK